MPQVKIKRKSIALDMTAMCDMAFLLLTFFILTAQFKPEEAVIVDTPNSVSDVPLPDNDILTINIRKDGAVFFGVDGQFTRLKMLESMATKYNIQFTDAQKQQFSLMANFGVPMAQLPGLLSLENSKRNKVFQSGIPCDSANNELRDWLAYARYANTKFRIAVKGDRNSNTKVAKIVIATLQEQNINKFNFITGLKAKPKDL